MACDSWPILMGRETAGRYLSLSEDQFATFAAASRLAGVITIPDLERWRRIDIDRLVATLPARDNLVPLRPARGALKSEAAPTRRKEGCGEGVSQPLQSALVSIRDAVALLSLSRPTLYRMIGEGKLPVRRIGRRTFIPRTAIDGLIEPNRPAPDD